VQVTLKVFTLAAEPVFTNTLDMRAGSGNLFPWDGRNYHGEDVSNGVYFYSIDADEFSALGKIAIVRR
jgi:hypothetical protein